MSDKLRLFLSCWFVSLPALYGQTVNGLICIANSGIPPTVRSESFAELTGDIVLNCEGGVPTPLGSPLPTADITVYFNTLLTSRLLSGSASEALLTVDEPLVSQTTAAQTCTAAVGCPAIGAGPNLVSNEFKAAFDSTTGASCTPGTSGCVLNPNVFQGTVQGNAVTFSKIPIDPPGAQFSRIYRITNVRADATTIGLVASLGQMLAVISNTPATNPVSGTTSTFAINNPTQMVAFVQPSMSAAVRNAANSGALTSPVNLDSPTITRVATLRFSELFATAFKRRTVPNQPADLTDVTVKEQNTLGLSYNSESGYYNARLGFTAGLADTGTRFKAVFHGVPSGVRLFVDTTYPAQTAGQTNLAFLTASETGPFSAVPATNGSAAEITISGGTGTAVWEYLGLNPLTVDNVDFGLYGMVTGSPASATITVKASYAPTGANLNSGTTLPRFGDTSTAVNVISTGPCPFGITTPATLSFGLLGASYGPLALGVCGGTPPYNWSNGSLPPGLSLSAGGILSGVPSVVGTTSFTVTVTDNASRTASQTFSLRVVQPLVFVNTTLPDAKVGESYSATLSASGGVAPYSWFVTNPPLPGSLALNPSTGTVSGTPPGAGVYHFPIRVTDSVGQSVTSYVQLTVAQSPGYVCTANAGVPPTIRTEGAAELAGDIVLLCSYVSSPNGPTAAGAAIATTDIQVTFTNASSDSLTLTPGSVAVPVTSRLLADPWTDALLTIDEPAKGKRFPCDTVSGICPAVGDGTGRTSYYSGGTVGTTGNNRNVFQGKKIAPNTLLFPAIPIDPPPGPNGTRIIRITNLRVNASVVPPGVPGQVIGTISAIGPAPVASPIQIVAFLQSGLNLSLRNESNTAALAPPTIDPCANPVLTRIATLRFSELFPTAFRRRVVPIPNSDPLDQTLVNQDTLGLVYNAETGFYDSSLSKGAGSATRGNLALSGLADFGTRLKAVFRNVPAGVRLFLDTSYSSGTKGSPNVVQMTSSETGPFSAVATTNGTAAEIPVSGGVGTAVWEYLGLSPLTSDNEDLGVYVMASGNPAPATVTVSGSFAPISTGTSAPQFVDTSTPLTLLYTRACVSTASISGRVTLSGSGLSGATVTLTGAGSGTIMTDASGNYNISGLTVGGNYTVTPSLTGYTFAPTSQTFSALSGNQTANFTASPVSYTVSGQVTLGGNPLGYISIQASGGPATVTLASGSYALSLQGGGTYTITPTFPGYSFSPPSQTLTNPGRESNPKLRRHGFDHVYDFRPGKTWQLGTQRRHHHLERPPERRHHH
jgi:hypothetical protein